MRDEEKLESILAMIDHIYQSDLNFSHLLPMRRGETFEFVKIGKRTKKRKTRFRNGQKYISCGVVIRGCNLLAIKESDEVGILSR